MEYLLKKMSSSDPQPIKLHLLKSITEDFSEKMKISSGGYAAVYKGVLNGDEIAVKKLFPVHGVRDEAFGNEFLYSKKVQHKNVIQMIGYCNEITHRDIEYKGQIVWSQVIDRALCFEYMKGGSLTNHISAESCIHDWPTTYKIINGTCEGLHHLHKGGETKIFHLDLKPDNVLLDEELVPKIGNSGFCRLVGDSDSDSDTVDFMKGTNGFMPQEYIRHCTVSPKNDVFSLGVIIFHMMAGAKGYDDYWDARRRPNFSQKIQQEFIESVQDYWKAKMQAYKGYRWDETDLLGVKICIEMAMRCVEDDRDQRPLITEIVGELKELDSKMEEILKKYPKPLMGQMCYQDGPWESVIPSKGSITSGPSSWYPEASRSTHSKNYLSATEPMVMTIQELHHVTDGFSIKRLLGVGAYGRVYKGVLDNGEVIAVKKFNSQHGLVEDSFNNELGNLMRVQHQNIIRAVGSCFQTRERVVEYKGQHVVAYEQEIALCLEYMEGGTLQEFLSGELPDWETSYKIIKGICQGLEHLHTGSEDPIFHLDLKPANVLLDKDRIPKISDFGLSRLLTSSGTFVTQTSSGTLGYMPPEYMHARQISSKFDVFSLGVIIVQIIAGLEGYSNYKCLYKSPQEFTEHVTGNWSKRVQVKTMSTEALMDVQKCINIALRCVEEDRAKRPTITEIVEELNMTGAGVEASVAAHAAWHIWKSITRCFTDILNWR